MVLKGGVYKEEVIRKRRRRRLREVINDRRVEQKREKG